MNVTLDRSQGMLCVNVFPASEYSKSDVQNSNEESFAFVSLVGNIVNSEVRNGPDTTSLLGNYTGPHSSGPTNEVQPPSSTKYDLKCDSFMLQSKKSMEQTVAKGSDKIVRARELNRLKQAKYRKRCQEQKAIVLKQLDDVRAQLERSIQRWRTLRQQRSELTDRLHSISEATPGSENAAQAEASHVQMGFTASIPTLPNRIIVSKSRNNGWYWFEHQRDGSQDLPTTHNYTHHLIVSYSRVLPFMPTSNKKNYDFSSFSIALTSYQHSLLQKCGASASDICWFHEWQSHSGFKFATSLPARSPECCLSASLAVISTAAECLFLSLQHDLLEGTPRSERRAHNPDRTFSIPPHPPDPDSLAHLRLRCSPHVTCPLEEAVSQVIQPMFRRYRRLLPRSMWYVACVQCMASLQASMPKVRPSESAKKGERHGATMDWSLLEAGQLALMQLVVLAISSTITEPSLADSGQEHVHEQSLESVRERMRAVLSGMSLATRVAIRSSAPIFCRIVFQQHVEKYKDSVKVERMTRRVYHQLRLSSDQKHALTTRWQSWTRRRATVSRNLLSALNHLNSSLLPATTLSDILPLLSCVLEPQSHSHMPSSSHPPPMYPLGSHHPMGCPTSVSPSPSPSLSRACCHLNGRQQDSPDTLGSEASGHHHLGYAHVRVDPRGTIPWDFLQPDGDLPYASCTQAAPPPDPQSLSASGSVSGSCYPSGTPSPGLTQKMPVPVFQDPQHPTVMPLGSGRNSFLCESELQFLCDAEKDGGGSDWPPKDFRSNPPLPPVPPHACRGGGAHNMHAASVTRMKALGQSAEMVVAAQNAMHEVRRMHEADSLMHEEFVGPYSELSEVQHAVLFAAHMQHGMRVRDMMEVMQIASQDVIHEKLFGDVEHLSL